MKRNKRQFRKYEDGLRERLADPEYAELFLELATEEYIINRDKEAFTLAVQEVINAYIGVPKDGKLTFEEYMKIMTDDSPQMKSLNRVLSKFGQRIRVEKTDD